eukprot:1817921-Lingulodinium_polyedra.AAC.1
MAATRAAAAGLRPPADTAEIACPDTLLFRNVTDGRTMMCSVLTLYHGLDRGVGDVDHNETYDVYLPPSYLRLFDGP